MGRYCVDHGHYIYIWSKRTYRRINKWVNLFSDRIQLIRFIYFWILIITSNFKRTISIYPLCSLDIHRAHSDTTNVFEIDIHISKKIGKINGKRISTLSHSVFCHSSCLCILNHWKWRLHEYTEMGGMRNVNSRAWRKKNPEKRK